MKRWQASLSLAGALLLGGCSGLNDLKHSELAQEKQALSVTPSTVTLRGGDAQSFSAAVNGTAEAVTWSVNGTPGGSAATGTISATGVFTAPEFPPAAGGVTITATDSADTTKTASATIALQNPVPTLLTISPSSVAVGNYSVTVNGLHFAPGAAIAVGGAPLQTTRVSSTQLTATGTATSAQIGMVALNVKNPDPGGAMSAAQNLQITKASDISVQVTPQTASVQVGGTVTLTATVSGSTNTAVTWSILDQGTSLGAGNATAGTISSSGVYTAPASLPAHTSYTIVATSVADTSKNASGTITLTNPAPAISALNPSSIGVGAFLLTVTGSNFVSGSTVNFGGQPLTTMFLSSTELTAAGTAMASQAGSVAVTVSNPGGMTSGALNAQVVNSGPQVSAATAVRFLEQSSFGPTPETMNQLQQTGLDAYLQGQFATPPTAYPVPLSTDSGLGNVQNAFFVNAVGGPDQLRQRMGLALSEIWVVSSNKVGDPTGYTNYISALNADAFGNYYDVMKDVTLTPAMGHMLDMVNNDKPGNGQHANENYARELMQLFTLGLSQLNSDGTPVLDGTGNPAPTYTQDDVMALGRSLTGWTYPTQPGQTLMKHNPEYYGGPMVVGQASNHDSGAKTFLGQPVPAGQTAEQELDTVLTIIFNHPNLPPFVSRQLIQKLVTSNPSPGYVQRVAQSFASGKYNNYGSGKRGDMQATIAAILFDQEARRGDVQTTAVASDGKLREPLVMVVGVARAFHATTDGSGFNGWATSMSQNLFGSPSVFNFFPPDSLIPGTTLNGPEFAIFNTNTSLARVNFVNSIVYGQISSNTKIDLTPVVNAGSPDQMVGWLNTLFLHGAMSDAMKQSVLTAVNTVSATDNKNQAKAAAYLVLSSSQYQVQH
ncbi:MAG TPA: DUF1800 family protein [Dongiaceae bacterium]|nr:DUF1800 family protein [Dongiaceae bacterium]